MGGTLSVVLSNCFESKLKRTVVIPLKWKFYNRFVDHTSWRKKKTKPDNLYNKMIFYHPDKKLIESIVEVNTKKFLNLKIL